MKLIPTAEAEGHVLAHDMTRIIKDVEKGALFKKGHVVTKADIPILLSIGKDHLYVWEKEAGILHEDEAAEILCSLCLNERIGRSAVSEGKIELIAAEDGLFEVDTKALLRVNAIENIMIATRYNYALVKKGDKLAGTRIIPLTIAAQQMEAVKRAAGDKPLLSLHPLKPQKAGIITTGNEVFYGRIKDTFTPVVMEKLKTCNIETVAHEIVDDNKSNIIKAIKKLKASGVDMILCTGGMSVDPDDQTPGAIKDSGADIVTYGAPVLPGAMFLLGYFADGIPIMGLPGCVMYAKATIFDIMLPRIAAKIKVERQDFISLGVGGLCLACEVCHYPNCSFGKGV